MFDRARRAYAGLRRVPLVGALASRLVWSVKGALGRPVRFPSAPEAATALSGRSEALQDREARLDARLQVVVAMLEALCEQRPPPARPSAEHRASPPPLQGRLAVSIVISTYDRAPYLRRTLDAVMRLRHCAFEVIVVDGPSTDETAAVLAAHGDRITVAHCPEPNLSMSRNIGVALARGDITAFIDDDAIPEPDWLDALVAGFADPCIGGVGGFIRDAGGVGFQCKVVVADRLGANQGYESLADAEADGLEHGPGARRYLSLTGANSAYRRTALLEVGGFDEAYAYSWTRRTWACA